MKILGLGGSIHDFSTCIIEDNKMYAIEDERITKIRYSEKSRNPCIPSCQFLLDYCSIKGQDIDYLVFNDDLQEHVDKNFGNYNSVAINHHLAHAYSTFFTSNFRDSAILIVDGAGSKKNLEDPNDETRETSSFYFGSSQNIKPIKKIYGTLNGFNPVSKSQTIMSNSLGEFYRIVAESVGLGWLTGPGKMMGMTSYGETDSKYINYLLESVEFKDNGEFAINTNGENGLVDRMFLLKKDIEKEKGDKFIQYATVAKSAQIIFERLLFHLLDYLHKVTGSNNLCLAGGAALNSVANGEIRKNSKFKNIHIVPYPGDHGLAIGTALWGYYNLNKGVKNNIRFSSTPFLSKNYTDSEILDTLRTSGLRYHKSLNINKQIAESINCGKVIARFHGSSEFGPRALGNRSILADPRNKDMRDYINFKIKNREWYRPLAPAILSDKAKEFFDTDYESEWMQFVSDVKKEYHEKLPAITHVDGSARLQTVSRDKNNSFYRVIEEFYKLSNIPILLNTSFNINGEPIVETPYDAIKAFKNSKIDILFLEDYIVIK